MTEPNPIEWESLALVGFIDGKARIISSVKPDVVFDVLAGLIADKKEDDEFEDDYWNDDFDKEAFLEEVRNEAARFEWKLYQTEDAKAVFCAACDEPEDLKG